MRVSIVYVNWNCSRLIAESIESIATHEDAPPHEIIVVDNGSTRDDPGALEALAQNVVLIRCNSNLGFAAANNIGARHATGDQLLFLNPDTRLLGPAVRLLSDACQRLPDAGIVGCKLLNKDFSIQTSAIQTFPTLLNQVLDIEAVRLRWPDCRLWNIGPLFTTGEQIHEVEVISGACMMVSRKVFYEVDGFSERYFMYAEDLDLCKKMHDRGYRNYYCGSVEILHYGGQSTPSHFSTRMKWRAIVMYLTTHRGAVYAWIFRGVMSLSAVLRLLLLTLWAGLVRLRGQSTSSALASARKWWLTLMVLMAPGDTRKCRSTAE